MTDSLLKELGVEDLYGFLGVPNNATEKEITKGYRKKALRYHPDKNPDDSSAAEMFQKLSRIYQVLTDPPARAAYDKWIRARELVKERNEKLSAQRKKFKESLESKESDHYKNLEAEYKAKEQMEKEIERLREMGYEMMRKQEEMLRETLKNPVPDEEGIIQVTWRPDQGPLSSEELSSIFSKYGELGQVILSGKKRKALISYARNTDAKKAKDDMHESFSITWVSGEPHPSLINEEIARPDGTMGETVQSSLEGPSRKRPLKEDSRTLEEVESDVFARLRKLQEMRDQEMH